MDETLRWTVRRRNKTADIEAKRKVPNGDDLCERRKGEEEERPTTTNGRRPT